MSGASGTSEPSAASEVSGAAALAHDLSEGIASGRYPVGSLLPTEFELCERYDASRYAVRQVLQELQELGLVSRRRNVGTRVEATRPVAGFTHAIATVDELAQFGATHRRVVQAVDEVVADLALAKELGCTGGSRWLRISSLRMDSGGKKRPIGWTDVYVDSAYTGVAELARASPDTLVSSLIEEKYGRRIAHIRQDIEAVGIPKELSEPLDAKAGSPGLKIVRRYFDAAGVPFEISVSIHPAGRFTFSTEMDRSRVRGDDASEAKTTWNRGHRDRMVNPSR